MSTSIEWTDETWNPVVGCTKVSQGCKNCYAKTLHDKRHKAYLDGKQMPKQYAEPFETIQLKPERLEQPLHWRNPRKIFVNSVSDLFHEQVPFEFIDRVFAIMAATPKHTYQILTKRPERMHLYLRNLYKKPLPNVWLGTSVENQDVIHRIDELRQVPAVLRFLSCEPLLGPLELDLHDIHWVIVGGESGKDARPMHPDWARAIRDQCIEADVPFFFKQWGAYGSTCLRGEQRVFRTFENKQQWINKASSWVNGGTCVGANGKVLKIGGDFSDSKVYPVAVMHKMSTKRAGCELDGRTWGEFPTT
ncbi:MAG: phage Gp37/Gp68 family protein [Deinococcota bacterium]